MKKIFYLVLLLCVVVSCDGGGYKNMKFEELFAKENKLQAKEKTIGKGGWSVEIKSKREHVGTMEELLKGIRKDNIINTVLYKGSQIDNFERTFSPIMEIKKTIKYDLSSIDFLLTIKILKIKAVEFPKTQSILIKGKDGLNLNFDCRTSYEKYTYEGDENFLHFIVYDTNISINDVNSLRNINNVSSAVFAPNDEYFSFPIPKEFFEFLREI